MRVNYYYEPNAAAWVFFLRSWKKACRAAYDASASFVKKKFAISEFRSQYVCSEFYTVLEHFLETPGSSSVVTERPALPGSDQAAFHFQPRVSIEDLPNATDRMEAREISQRLGVSTFLQSMHGCPSYLQRKLQRVCRWLRISYRKKCGNRGCLCITSMW